MRRDAYIYTAHVGSGVCYIATGFVDDLWDLLHLCFVEGLKMSLQYFARLYLHSNDYIYGSNPFSPIIFQLKQTLTKH